MNRYEQHVLELARQAREAATARDLSPAQRASAEAQRLAMREAYQRRVAARAIAHRARAVAFIGGSTSRFG